MTTQQDAPAATVSTRSGIRRSLWLAAAALLVAIGTITGVLAAQHIGNTAPEDLDGLAAADSRFDPQNRGLHSHAIETAGSEWIIKAGWAGEFATSSDPTTVDAWSDGGTTLTVGPRDYRLAGVSPGTCAEYGTELMTWLTKGHEVLVDPVADDEAIVWIVNRGDDGDTSVQLANALAVRFGVGHGLDADPSLAIAGILADESAAPSDQWRPETAACMGRG